MKRTLHPQSVPGEPLAIRWVTDVDLPVGRVVKAPGTVGPMLEFDVLTKVFVERGVADFIQRPFSIRPAKAGVYQGIVGTVTCAVIVALVAFPLGLASAIYLEEYSSDGWFTRVIDVVIRNLAGVPAVVYGLLGYAIFGDFPTPSKWLGIAIIVASGLFIIWREHRSRNLKADIAFD